MHRQQIVSMTKCPHTKTSRDVFFTCTNSAPLTIFTFVASPRVQILLLSLSPACKFFLWPSAPDASGHELHIYSYGKFVYQIYLQFMPIVANYCANSKCKK